MIINTFSKKIKLKSFGNLSNNNYFLSNIQKMRQRATGIFIELPAYPFL